MKAPLFVALAAILATLFPAAGAQAQTSTSCPSIAGTVTGTIRVNAANQECTLENSGRINVNADNGSAFNIRGAGSKIVSYGNINLRAESNAAFNILSSADNVEIEFLSGSVISRDMAGQSYVVYSDGGNTKLTFGGTALVAGNFAYFFRDATVTGVDNEVILLPGAVIHNGDRSRPLAGVSSAIGESQIDSSTTNVLKIGNFYDGDEPVDDRRGWVHAGQWDFGPVNQGTHQLIVDTNPGVRFSIRGGVNHHRSGIVTENAIYGLHSMDIRSGNVVLGGSVYMPNGKVYIHDAGRLTFEIGKRRDAPSTRIGEMIISRLVADEVIFNSANYEDPRVFIQFAHYLTDSDIERFRKQLAYSEFISFDAATRALDGGNVYKKPSRIFVVNKVLYDRGNDLSHRTSLLRVASSGRGGIRDVGRIALEDLGGLDKGSFQLINDEDAGNIGQLQFSSDGTGPAFTGGSTGGGSTGTGTGGGGGSTGTGSGTGTGDTGTGTGDTGTGDTGTGGTGTGDTGTGTGDTGTSDTGTGSAGTGGGGGSGGGGGGILVIGLLAALMGGLDLDESESELGNYYAFDRKPAKKRSRSSSYFSGLFRSERGMWVRPAQSRFTSFGASYFGAVSHRMSWDLQQSGDYFLRASLSPATSVSPTGWHSSASGETLSLSGAWHRDDRRLQFGITHGRYDANAKFFDSATQGNLFGESTFRHTSVHASAVQELSGGPMKMSASASLTAGQVEQAAYDAENAVMKAKVPAYRQSYTGTRLGFSAKSRKWFSLSDAVSVKPRLKVASMRTRASVNDPVWLRQSDKVGALSFENATVLQGVPKSLNVVGIGTDVKPSDSRGVWRLGYAGMEVDGEYQHAAVAAYQMRF